MQFPILGKTHQRSTARKGKIIIAPMDWQTIKKQEVNKDGWRILDLTIIHFTPFRYETKIKRINDAESSNPLNA